MKTIVIAFALSASLAYAQDSAVAPEPPHVNSNAPKGPAPLAQPGANPDSGGALVTGHEPGITGQGREASGGNVDAMKAEARATTDVKKAQKALAARGYDIEEDGIAGPETSKAIRQFQAENGLHQTGSLDAATVEALEGSKAIEKAGEEPSGL